MASNVGMPETAVIDALKEASLQKATGAGEIYNKAVKYLDERTACDLLLTLPVSR